MQDVEYSVQLERKQQLVESLFGIQTNPIIPCADPWHYRNKMEFTFSQNKAGEKFLGLILKKTRGHVFHLEECPISPLWFSEVVVKVRAWWEASSLRAYHMHKNEGALRYLTLREGKFTGDKMAMLTVSGNPDYPLTKEQVSGFVDLLKAIDPHMSIFLRIHQVLKGSPTQFYEIHLSGLDHIKEKLLGFTFKISPTSFFQPNSAQAEVLYAKAIEMLGEAATIYDLYCGTATIGIALSKRAKKVIGIELNPHAVFDAEANIELNQIQNVQVYQGDVGKLLPTLEDKPDAVVIDPPRAGLDLAALNHLLALKPPKILYISCNPATQAQNVQSLTAEGYHLIQLQPVDQFPHTPHIENIALLERIS